jgi:type II secretory ATPase GspE/PulE/Tfp pilus assembly ATPase PilB-like protein
VKFRRYIKEPYGMVLVTGPTGSGKTTTLYAALSEIKNDEDKIITIEDPVEYQIKGITQIPVNEKKGLTFARGLRSILRHDPDKIMVGEIRDQETAQIAINSALTGHLVFTTVHANNVLDVLGRFLNMGVEPYNFVSALNCILAQRLVRVICEHCKRGCSTRIRIWWKAGSTRTSGATCRFWKARAASSAAARASAGARRSTNCWT